MKRRSTLTLYDQNTVAPEALDIKVKVHDQYAIAAWWAKVKLYAEAMRGLDRVTMLVYDAEEDCYHVASVPEVPNA